MFEDFVGKIQLEGKDFHFCYKNKYLTIFPSDLEESWLNYDGLLFSSKQEDLSCNLNG